MSPIDISTLEVPPIRFHVERLGWLALDLYHEDFLTWYGRNGSATRWPDPEALMRAILLEQARDDVGAAPAKEAVEALSPDEIEAAAAAFLGAAGAGLARHADAAEATPENESDTRRLARLLAAYVAAMTPPLRQRTEAGLHPPRARSGATASIERAATEHQRRMSEIARAVSGVTAFQRSVGNLQHTIHLAEFARRTTLSNLPELLSASSAASRITLLPHANLLQAASAMTQMQATARRIAEAGTISQRFSALRELGALTQPVKLNMSAFAEAQSLSRLLRTQFDFRTPALALAALTATQAMQADWAEMAQRIAASVEQPGFQATASAALNGLAPQGAASDVLGHYALDVNSDSPVFATVMEAVTSLDDADPQTGPERLEAALARLEALAHDILRQQNRPITLAGVSVVISLVLAVASLYVGYAAWQGDVEDHKRPGAEEIINRLDRLVAAQPNLRAERDIRYVHARAWLRAVPSPDGQPLRTVFPDQPLRVLEAGERWAKVEVFDYASDRPMVGWISRRHLRLTPPGAP